MDTPEPKNTKQGLCLSFEDFVNVRLEALYDKIENQEKLNELRFKSVEEATKVSVATLNERFRNTNEWRDALQQREIDFARRDRLESLETTVKEIQIAFSNLSGNISGKASQNSLILTYVVAVLSFVFSALALFLK